MKNLVIRGVLILAILWLAVVVMNSISKPATTIGLTNGRLAACPGSPNCISTMSDDDVHRAEPIPFEGTAEEAMARVKEILADSAGWSVVAEEQDYLHATATTTLLRFVDDVEFYFDEDTHLLHFRSASRVGYSDLGKNRRRMQQFRQRFSDTATAPKMN